MQRCNHSSFVHHAIASTHTNNWDETQQVTETGSCCHCHQQAQVLSATYQSTGRSDEGSGTNSGSSSSQPSGFSTVSSAIISGSFSSLYNHTIHCCSRPHWNCSYSSGYRKESEAHNHVKAPAHTEEGDVSVRESDQERVGSWKTASNMTWWLRIPITQSSTHLASSHILTEKKTAGFSPGDKGTSTFATYCNYTFCLYLQHKRYLFQIWFIRQNSNKMAMKPPSSTYQSAGFTASGSGILKHSQQEFSSISIKQHTLNNYTLES